MHESEKEKFYLPFFLFAIVILAANIFWFCYDFFYAIGLKGVLLRDMFLKLERGGVFRGTALTKLFVVGFLLFGFIVRSGKTIDMSWGKILTILGTGLVLFFLPHFNSYVYIVTSVAGFILTRLGITFAGRKARGIGEGLNDAGETFDQMTRKVESDMIINIPYRFQYLKRMRNGWINILPQRGVMILGTPGSGKTYSLYNPIIDSMISRGFSLVTYDYKYPALTQEVYNRLLQHREDVRPDGSKVYPVAPKFCVLNFDDPRYSMRCNPLAPHYLTDPADASEVADLIMRNVNPAGVEKEDFFSMSAKVYIDCCIWFLRTFEEGRFCTFPHLIELMGRSYEAVFRMLQQHADIRVKMAPFANALAGKAQEQLQGQIASAQIPLARFASPSLYWVLSGEDFTLDANNPDEPKVICVGNNPDRQAIYSTTLALYMSRVFKTINHPYNSEGRRNVPCGVLLDELPTIFLKDLSNVIDTARSNRVCVVLGAQDKSQIVRDFGDKEAEVIFNTVGNILAGQVNGETARKLSETFGKEFREQRSQTTGGERDTMNRSFQQQEILPQSRIETLSQGYFFGKVADEFAHPVEKKLFCGEIIIDQKERKAFEKGMKPLPSCNVPEFREKEIEAQMRQKPKSSVMGYLRDKYLAEEAEKQRRDPTVTAATAGSPFVKAEIERQYAALSREQKIALLEKAIKKAQDEMVEKVIREKYDAIKNDILYIFNKEGIKEHVERGSVKSQLADINVGDMPSNFNPNALDSHYEQG